MVVYGLSAYWCRLISDTGFIVAVDFVMSLLIPDTISITTSNLLLQLDYTV